MHKKYIKRGNKRFGPYLYETYRENGQIKTAYIGKSSPEKNAQSSFYLPLIVIFSLFILFLIYNKALITGAVISLDKTTINLNEQLKGNFEILMKNGEFLPSDSIISVYFDDSQINIPLREFLSLSKVNLQEKTGEFYSSKAEISGFGNGYGWTGTKVSYPEVSFRLEPEIFSAQEDRGQVPYQPQTIEGSVKFGDEFVYDGLANLVSGSVSSNGNQLSDNYITIRKENGRTIVSTTYYEESEGFGKDYLTTNENLISLDLSKLNISSKTSGTKTLLIELSYNSVIIESESQTVEVKEYLEMPVAEMIGEGEAPEMPGAKIQDVTCDNCTDCNDKMQNGITLKLSQDTQTNLSCIRINVSNLIFDCQNHVILNNGTSGLRDAITLFGSPTENITIQNCIINTTYFGFTNNGLGTGTNYTKNLTIKDSIFYGSATQTGIYLRYANSSYILNNSISSFANNILVGGDAYYNIIENNTVGNASTYGIQASNTRTAFNNITGNSITVLHTTAATRDVDNRGVNTTIWDNNFYGRGLSNQTSGNSWFLCNPDTASGQGNYFNSISGLNTTNQTVSNGTCGTLVSAYPPPKVSKFDGATTNFSVYDSGNVSLTIENTTYARINWPSKAAWPYGQNVEHADFDSYFSIGNHSIIVNISYLPADVNSAANITFYGISFNQPRIAIDPELDGTYKLCSDCSIISYSSGNLTFNTTHFSGIQGFEQNVSSCGNLSIENAVYYFNNSFSAIGTCLNVLANNVTLDCQGFNITGSGSGYGINISGFNNTAIKNCTIASFDRGMYLLSSSNNRIINCSGSSNVNYGIYMNLSSNNVIDSLNLSSGSTGIQMYYSPGNNITNFVSNVWNCIQIHSFSHNNIVSNSAPVWCANYGIQVYNSSNTTIQNFVCDSACSGAVNAISLKYSDNSLLINNTLNSSRGSGDYGLDVEYSNNTRLKDQYIEYYNLNNTGLIVEKSSKGILTYLQLASQTGINLSDDIRISDNLIEVNSSQTGFNKSANVTLYNISVFNRPAILRNGVVCNSTTSPRCYNFTALTGTVMFNVSSFTNYSIGEAPNNPPTSNSPILNSTLGKNTTAENITCYPQNLSDANNDAVYPIFNWYKNNQSTAVLIMPFDSEVSSAATGAIKDYSGFNNNGTLINNPVWTSGKIGGAYGFDGVNDYINISGSDSLDTTDDITVEAWIYPLSQNIAHHRISAVVTKYNWPDTSYWLGIDWNVSANAYLPEMWFDDCGCDDYPGEECPGWEPIPMDTWTHIAWNFDNSSQRLKIYQNGRLTVNVSTASLACGTTYIPSYPSVPVRIGASINYTGTGGLNYFFNGTIDNVRIYNYSLSSQEIYQHFIEGNQSLNISTIVSQETEIGDVWKCSATPNDLKADGEAKNSTEITLLSPSLCGTTLTNNLNLSENLYCNGTALKIGVNNLVIDCNGSSIIGNSTGIGINAITSTNGYSFTARNCTISNFTSSINASGASNAGGDGYNGGSIVVENSNLAIINNYGGAGSSNGGNGGNVYLTNSNPSKINAQGGGTADSSQSYNGGLGGFVNLTNSATNEINVYGGICNNNCLSTGDAGNVNMTNSNAIVIYAYGGFGTGNNGGDAGHIILDNSSINRIDAYGRIGNVNKGGDGGNITIKDSRINLATFAVIQIQSGTGTPNGATGTLKLNQTELYKPDGAIKFSYVSTNQTAFNSIISLSSNLIQLDSDIYQNYNVSANLTLYNTDLLLLSNRAPYRNGAKCPVDVCVELSDSDTYVFNVTGFTNYSVGEFDTTAPVITIVNPIQNSQLLSGTTSTLISISTNENAVCRYNLTNATFDFSDGSLFTSTGTLSHTFTFSPLSDGASYSLYYKCNDSLGNINPASEQHNFSVAQTPPPAGCSKPWACNVWQPDPCNPNSMQARACTCDCSNPSDCYGDSSTSRTCPTPCTHYCDTIGQRECLTATTYRQCAADAYGCRNWNSLSCPSGQSCNFTDNQCYAPCTENWNCSDWSSCAGGLQTRICTDLNNCGTSINKPAESQICQTNCSDGTLYNVCSFNKPKFCSNGILIDKCSSCGCPDAAMDCLLDESCAFECADDDDCIAKLGAGYECKSNKCWKEEKECDVDADCPAGKYCLNGVCKNLQISTTGAPAPELKEIKCNPQWKCEEISECKLEYSVASLLELSTAETLQGKQERKCIDTNNCMPPRIESISCEKKLDIRVEREIYCNEPYINIYSLDGTLIATMKEREATIDITLGTEYGLTRPACEEKAVPAEMLAPAPAPLANASKTTILASFLILIFLTATEFIILLRKPKEKIAFSPVAPKLPEFPEIKSEIFGLKMKERELKPRKLLIPKHFKKVLEAEKELSGIRKNIYNARQEKLESMKMPYKEKRISLESEKGKIRAKLKMEAAKEKMTKESEELKKLEQEVLKTREKIEKLEHIRPGKTNEKIIDIDSEKRRIIQKLENAHKEKIFKIKASNIGKLEKELQGVKESLKKLKK